ncbi:AbrB family transcriptional regulator [bacterium]|nr:AbrB family transcriptional regulator [bacterium]
MGNIANLTMLMFVGLVGGLIGQKLKIPAGALMGAMVAVILVKVILKSEYALPKNIIFLLQVLVGVMVGSTFHPSLLATFHKIIIPVVASCFILVITGVLIAFLFTKLGWVDIGTGYLGTSPGAMTVLLVLSLENNVNATVITCFHLFRVVFVILTAPLILKLISH